MQNHLTHLKNTLDGELYFDRLLRSIYATDASVYRELPLAVAYPKTVSDIKKLIAFATEHGSSLIPRAAGTSLAGQCVGTGIVVDISKHWNKILEVNVKEKWVRVQPGVIRDELNFHLKKHGLYFGPNTSTANRCMVGGMVGNNSCGSTSISVGSTRDHLLEVEAILSDGSEIVFGNNSFPIEKLNQLNKSDSSYSLEEKIYRQLISELNNSEIKSRIHSNFPKKEIHRRNTGYAVDLLLDQKPFSPKGKPLNLSTLLAGSEGTLAFTTAVKLNLLPLPPPCPVVLAAHFHTIDECMRAVLTTMEFKPYMCELMDKVILDCTKGNIEQSKNRFFIHGDPGAVLMIEFREDDLEKAKKRASAVAAALEKENLGYAYPLVEGDDTKRVWALRSAGLGVLANLPGDGKAVACIEDTAVALPDLPIYISEFREMMEGFGQEAIYYAHAGAGEIHLRPILNLKKSEDVKLFHDITEATAKLVKKYGGSLSGEHGDGRVRAEFIPLMIGEENYELLRRIKKTWDPHGIFNPGKITDAAPMIESLRYIPDAPQPEYETTFNFSETGGLLRAAEKCNGSGDCRRLDLSGGTMCPSYRATRNEKDTTRARANMLREVLSGESKNPFASPELKEVMDLCLSCKGCTSECPSNVDMSSMKAEVLYQSYKTNGTPLRAKIFGNINNINKWLSLSPSLSNFFTGNSFFGNIAKNTMGVAKERSLPPLYKYTLRQWFKKNKYATAPNPKGEVYFFCDEFTNYYDVEIGIKAIQLLNRLGYQVNMVEHPESGRAFISKGLLKEAKNIAKKNVSIFSKIISDKKPLIGIEPSAILSFRDEYPRLVDSSQIAEAKSLKENTFLIDEFLAQEMNKGKITSDIFTSNKKKIMLHGHCHQKALSDVNASAWICGLPENYEVEMIPSSCCGMAGSFGYEKEHYKVSMKIGDLVLFPKINSTSKDIIIAAPGTSCRHQIWDGTKRKAFHPVEILFEALK